VGREILAFIGGGETEKETGMHTRRREREIRPSVVSVQFYLGFEWRYYVLYCCIA
jgi:hypothetical protein